jgi:Ribosomal protein S11.
VAEEEIKETAAAAAEAPVAAATEEVKVKKGKKRVDIQGIACVNATFNNTIVSITDARGNVVALGSSG